MTLSFLKTRTIYASWCWSQGNQTTLANKADKSEIRRGGITQQQLDTAIQGSKTAHSGRRSARNSTLKKLQTVSPTVQDLLLNQAIVSKMTDWDKFTDLENTDFVQIYTTVKK